MRDPAIRLESYRDFVEALKGLAEHLTDLITGDKAFVPMVHYLADGGVPMSSPVEKGWFEDEHTMELIENLVIPTALGVSASAVAWSFCGGIEDRAIEPAHEAAVLVVIDRERHEVHEARLVRHDNRASLGAWRPWPANQQAGRLVTPIQEALR